LTIKGVDLLPTEKKRLSFDPMIIVMIILIALSIPIYMQFGSRYPQKIAALEKEKVEIQSRIKAQEELKPLVDQCQKEISGLEAQIKLVKDLQYDSLKYSNLLIEFASLMPTNVWITNLSIEPGPNLAKFSGTAIQTAGNPPLWTIAYFMKSLQTSRYFRSATLSSVNQTQVDLLTGYTFQMETSYDPASTLENSTTVPSEQKIEKTEQNNIDKSKQDNNITNSPKEDTKGGEGK